VIKPHIHVPYDGINTYLPFVQKEKLNLEIYFGSSHFDDFKKADVTELKNKLSYTPEFTIHAPFMDLSPGAVDSKVRDITARRFSDVLDFARILESRVVVFHSGYDKWKYDSRVDIWLEGSLKTWEPLVRKAETAGIKIAIENIFEDEPTHLELLVNEIKSDYFGLCFDSGHFNVFSRIPLSDWLEVVKPYIFELHLHDNLKDEDSHFAIGDGNFDFDALFKELKGTECFYTIEARSVEDVKKSIENLKGYLE